MGGPGDYSSARGWEKDGGDGGGKAPKTGAAEEEDGKQNSRLRTPSRDGTRLIAGHFDHSVSHQLRIIAAEEETTIQALLTEALDLLFLKRHKPTIEELRQGKGR